MGKAGKALKQVLSTYGISQNRLAVTMGINRSTVHQWVNEISDPLAEAVTQMIKALRQINSTAAEDFIDLYLERQPPQPSAEPEDNL
ncbi:helix-turn-helix transcriptional regulator [Leptolyngbya sp. FACHB-17]|uniref:helix-turn-helix domain-containing protein n=1 Tax=unclassified Leptolyngbya TaxID=2650499 RepID=UPI00168155AF|nr:helix-turn-helix transcriptional regulator [Leptolyngbya sp. FACHB-17]MBD2082069.1 helix-turn-helix transcriptional regulator [Leptolyngbya sp. FACHB-17]